MTRDEICEECMAHGCDTDFDRVGNVVDLCESCPYGPCWMKAGEGGYGAD